MSRGGDRLDTHAGADLTDQVRDALRHRYDYAYLQTHPLARLVAQEPGGYPGGVGWRLGERLQEAIVALRPSSVPADRLAERRHRLVSLRYLEAREQADVERTLAISRSTYHREHAAALAAVTSLLQARWHIDDRLVGSEAPRDGQPPPAFLTSFIGRERALLEVDHLLAASRLVTLSGPPGAGKTRLACEAASRSRTAYEDGVCFVSLAAIRAAEEVLPSIAQAAGIREVGGVPILATLKEALHGRQMLLILDNCEQILSPAPVVASLLRAAPRLSVLATSRTPLGVYGEHDFLVPPLTLPDRAGIPLMAACASSEAVQLFTERARAAQATFALTDANVASVVAICRHLDGLPLAIELAAAQLRFLTPSALLARLGQRLPMLLGGGRDLPKRQQTLRAAIDWSFDLLDADYQILLRRLSTFAGGCTIEAAEAVCGGDTPTLSIVAGMAALVDQRLLRQDEHPNGDPRFVLLECIREYALERLEASGEAERFQRAHARYFLGLAEVEEGRFRSLETPGHAAWADRLEAEHDNLRAALHWCESRPAVEEGLRLAAALAWFWLRRNEWSEGRYWLDRLLALPGSEGSSLVEAHALQAAGIFALAQGDLVSAQPRLKRSVAIWRERGDDRQLAASLGAMAAVDIRNRDPAAEALAAESLALFQALGDRRGVGAMQLQLGSIAVYSGDFARAHALLNESRAFWVQVGEPVRAATADTRLGLLAMAEADHATARVWLEQSLAAFRELGDQRGVFRQGLAIALMHLGELDAWEGNYAGATMHCREGLAMARELGDADTAAWSIKGLGRIARQRGDERRAMALFREALALRRRSGQLWAVAACLRELAEGAMRAGESLRAVRLFAAADRHRGAPTTRWTAADLSEYAPADRARHLASLRAELGDRAFEAAWAEGAALPLEQAIDEALAASEPFPVARP